GTFEPENIGCTRRRRIVPGLLQQVRTVDSSSLDPHPNLPGLQGDSRLRTPAKQPIFSLQSSHCASNIDSLNDLKTGTHGFRQHTKESIPSALRTRYLRRHYLPPCANPASLPCSVWAWAMPSLTRQLALSLFWIWRVCSRPVSRRSPVSIPSNCCVVTITTGSAWTTSCPARFSIPTCASWIHSAVFLPKRTSVISPNTATSSMTCCRPVT